MSDNELRAKPTETPIPFEPLLPPKDEIEKAPADIRKKMESSNPSNDKS